MPGEDGFPLHSINFTNLNWFDSCAEFDHIGIMFLIMLVVVFFVLTIVVVILCFQHILD